MKTWEEMTKLETKTKSYEECEQCIREYFEKKVEGEKQ